MEGCVGALVGEMSEERKALVRKVCKKGQRQREREGERSEGEERGEGEGGRKERMRASNCPKGGLHTDIFISGVSKVGQPKERYHSTG